MNRVAILIYCLLLHSGGNAVTKEKEPLVFAVHPYQAYHTLIRKYTPLARYLSEQTGRDVVVRVGKDYESHIAFVGENDVDLALLGPASYVKMVDAYGLKPLLARFEVNGEPQFKGVIIVRKENKIERLEALRGLSMAFGDRASTMSHLVPRLMLHEAGVRVQDLADFQFLGSHDNVALAVLAGVVDAGAVKEEIFDKYWHRGLRALAYTQPISEHVIVANNRLSPETVTALRNALYALRDSPAGRRILQRIKQTMTSMTAVSDEDYDNLRRVMNLLAEQGVR